jgi:hypothetical protein
VKTRLGKSNVVKLLAQAIIDATESDKTVGQLIFDINGEYANDNPQDGSRSIGSPYLSGVLRSATHSSRPDRHGQRQDTTAAR